MKNTIKLFAYFFLILLMVFSITYLFLLNSKVINKLDGALWTVPAKVYSRHLVLAEEAYINIRKLILELSLLSYEEVNEIQRPGEFELKENTLNIFLTSLNVPIYYVMIKSSPEIRRRAQELLHDFPSLKLFDLHHPDSTYLAFTRDTKSTLITSDKDLIKCCTYAPQLMKHVRFHTLLEKIMQPGPIKEMLRKRREYYKDRPQPHWSKGAFNRSNKKGKKKQKNLGKKSCRYI